MGDPSNSENPRRFSSSEERREAYEQEKGKRWEMENFFRDHVMNTVQNRLKQNGYPSTTWDDNDSHLEGKSESKLDAYERGTPDCTINLESKTWFCEVKIKTTEFLKTSFNSYYTDYDSPSHYLDPYVIDQIKQHCDYYDISHSDVIILFAYGDSAEDQYTEEEYDDSEWDFGVFRFDNLVKKVSDEYTRINPDDSGGKGSGYGQRSYLVPTDDITQAADFDW